MQISFFNLLSQVYCKYIILFPYWEVNIILDYKRLKMFSLIDMRQLYICMCGVCIYGNLGKFQ